jgi:catechol 2,3-dioxygenase-like lactoylglutathione lyase family enzyme
MLDYTNAYSCLSIDDVRKAKNFYGGDLGLEVAEKDNGIVVYFKGGQTVFMYTDVEHKPAAYAVLNFVVEDFDKAVKALEGRGVIVSDVNPNPGTTFPGGNGQKVGWFNDYSGNIISLVQS